MGVPTASVANSGYDLLLSINRLVEIKDCNWIMLDHFMSKQCNTANVKDISGMYKSQIAKTIVNVCQLRYSPECFVESVSVEIFVMQGKIPQNFCGYLALKRHSHLCYHLCVSPSVTLIEACLSVQSLRIAFVANYVHTRTILG